ncbi:MAG: hypothetical protein ACK5Y2_06800 [Bdellovibrionales bacterium]
MKKLILFLAAVGFVTPVYSSSSCGSMDNTPLVAPSVPMTKAKAKATNKPPATGTRKGQF